MNMLWLQLRNELWKLFAKKRTYIGLLMFLLAQNAIVLLFRFAPGPQQAFVRRLEGNGYLAQDFISGLTVAAFMAMPLAYILLPLFVALVGGDLVAKEAEDGTLRMILARPISRVRLVLLKWVSGVMFCVGLVVALGLLGLAFAHAWFPRGGLFVMVPGEVFAVFDPAAGLRRYLLAHVLMATKATTILTLALMFSCANVKPATATVLALSVVFANFILQNIPYFESLQHWFLTYHLNAWQLLFADPIPWWRVGEALSVLAGFNATFLAVGVAMFHMRDLKA
jgi:ABC-2 type transport system permease protein